MAVWSTIGSVGVASAADLSKLLFLNSIVQLGPGTGGGISNPGVSVTARSPAAPSLITLGTQVSAVIRYGVDVSRDAFVTVEGEDEKAIEQAVASISRTRGVKEAKPLMEVQVSSRGGMKPVIGGS